MNKVAVYGSLLSGLGNHGLLVQHNAILLGEDITDPTYTMVSLGGFPGIVEDGDTPIKIEVYEVDEQCELSLDRLEGYNRNNPKTSFYIKKSITTKYGETFIYIINRDYDKNSPNKVTDGDWRRHQKEKTAEYYRINNL